MLMQAIQSNIIINKFIDFILIKFPICFPIIYGLILYLLPSFENFLIFFTLLILAEPHFGATWPFFFNKTNHKWILENKLNLLFFPVLIIILSLIGFFKYNEFFLLIFLICNIYHVTRQSYGICKLYNKSHYELKFQEMAIYAINILYFIIAFLRFYTHLLAGTYLFLVNLFIILLLIFLLIFYIKKYKYSDNFLTFVTGLIIFLPFCFVDKPIHGIIMGVTMHYTQYLSLTYKVTQSRNLEEEKNNLKKRTFFGLRNFNFIFFILFYGLVMSVLAVSTKFDNEVIKTLIVIPIIGQMIHFYIDSQLWKFSIKHNRNVTLKYLLKT